MLDAAHILYPATWSGLQKRRVVLGYNVFLCLVAAPRMAGGQAKLLEPSQSVRSPEHHEGDRKALRNARYLRGSYSGTAAALNSESSVTASSLLRRA